MKRESGISDFFATLGFLVFIGLVITFACGEPILKLLALWKYVFGGN